MTTCFFCTAAVLNNQNCLYKNQLAIAKGTLESDRITDLQTHVRNYGLAENYILLTRGIKNQKSQCYLPCLLHIITTL